MKFKCPLHLRVTNEAIGNIDKGFRQRRYGIERGVWCSLGLVASLQLLSRDTEPTAQIQRLDKSIS